VRRSRKDTFTLLLLTSNEMKSAPQGERGDVEELHSVWSFVDVLKAAFEDSYPLRTH